jgi:hypothetical protein
MTQLVGLIGGLFFLVFIIALVSCATVPFCIWRPLEIPVETKVLEGIVVLPDGETCYAFHDEDARLTLRARLFKCFTQ